MSLSKLTLVTSFLLFLLCEQCLQATCFVVGIIIICFEFSFMMKDMLTDRCNDAHKITMECISSSKITSNGKMLCKMKTAIIRCMKNLQCVDILRTFFIFYPHTIQL